MSSNNNNNNPRVRILSGEDNEEEPRQLFGDLYNIEPMFSMVMFNNRSNQRIINRGPLTQTVEFSRNEDPSRTISRFLESVSNFDIVDDLFYGLMDRERMVENTMMEMAMRESLDQYKTQEKKPDVELCVEGELATKDHLDKSCVICKSDFELDEKITVLECKHIFHTECISEWIKYKSECPTCRAKIHTTFTEEEEKNINNDPVDI